MKKAMAASPPLFGHCCRVMGLKGINEEQAAAVNFRLMGEPGGADNPLFMVHGQSLELQDNCLTRLGRSLLASIDHEYTKQVKKSTEISSTTLQYHILAKRNGRQSTVFH